MQNSLPSTGRAGDADAALAQFERFVQLAPSEPTGHYQLGALYRQTGRTAEAIAQFETAAKLDPRMVEPIAATRCLTTSSATRQSCAGMGSAARTIRSAARGV